MLDTDGGARSGDDNRPPEQREPIADESKPLVVVDTETIRFIQSAFRRENNRNPRHSDGPGL